MERERDLVLEAKLLEFVEKLLVLVKEFGDCDYTAMTFFVVGFQVMVRRVGLDHAIQGAQRLLNSHPIPAVATLLDAMASIDGSSQEN